MFEPQLPHNRAEFERLKGLQLRLVIGTPLGALLIWTIVAVFSLSEWDEVLVLALLLASFVWIGVLEVRKTLLFRRDLRESANRARGLDGQ